jgi:uncharacterized protein (DUF305 family)
MNTTKTLIIAVVLAAGVAAAGVAVAQSTWQSGPGMQDGMRGPMHGGMQGMHAEMHGGMHGGMQGGAGHSQGHGQGGPAGDQSASSLAFHAVNEKMHRGMAITFTGNADVDFVRGMIPHHQGAVDMAKIVLAFGKDAEIKKLAEEIVKAQESEIAFMTAWAQKKGQ